MPDPLVLWASIYEQKLFNVFDRHAPPRFISRKIKDKIFNVPYQGFFQINPAVSEKLVAAVIGFCQLTGQETVLDAYCGCGLFTLFLAEKAKNVFGIESDKDSAYSAVLNAKNYECRNIRIIKGTVEEKIFEIVQSPDRGPTLALLDPPRAGCSREALEAIAVLRPRKIIYISCDPATQARDARVLVERGFRLAAIRPFDMFPQTRHVEVVCVFENKES
jgi:23S rRNA (uracil1939-C5)-methyltransferase